MTYFRHSELVNRYHVSLKTVHNWIDAAKAGKLGLKLVQNGSRTYVADNPGNTLILEKLSEQGKKYRNARFHKTVTPKPEFYDIFNRRQILDIINNLMVHREIPSKYNYFNGAAASWDVWVRRLSQEPGANILNNSLDLLRLNQDAIDQMLQGYSRVNIIDLGAGNAYPVRNLLEHLSDKGILNRYIALDISPSMLDIAKSNIKEWFGDHVRFEGHVRDITSQRFDDLIVDDMLDSKADETINLVLLLGGTFTNFRSPTDVVRNVYNSLGQKDLWVYIEKVDTEATRRYFDFHPNAETKELTPVAGFTLKLLNVDDSLYDVEMGYDEAERMRYVRIRFNAPFTLQFDLANAVRNVSFERGDTVLLLRMRHMTTIEAVGLFEDAGFRLLQLNMARDKERVFTLFGVDGI